MKTKTSIIAAISLAAAGLSQAAIPVVWNEFATFEVSMPSGNPGTNPQSTPQTIELNPTNAPNSSPGANALPAADKIAAIKIEFTFTVSGQLTATAVQPVSTITMEIQPELALSSATFNYTSNTGNNGYLAPLVSNSGGPLSIGQSLSVTANSSSSTETWTITDIASFFNSVPESFQVRLKSNFDVQGEGDQTDFEVNVQGGALGNIQGKAYYTLVPEPSSAALGVIGMSMILLRRRR